MLDEKGNEIKPKQVDLTPILGDLCFALAQNYHAAGRLAEAAHFYGHTLNFSNDTPIHEGLMYALVMMRQYAAAIPHCTECMKSPDQIKHDLAQYNRGLCYLMIGNYPKGFKDYDTRMRMGQTVDILRRKIGERPLWDGKPCNHLLVYGEQGMGDLFMFSRYMNMLVIKYLRAGRINKITFEVPPGMVEFMAYNFPDVNVIAQSEEITQSDEHMLLVSLARIFETQRAAIPYTGESLRAEPKFIDKWQHIAALPGLKVGVCWAGRSEAVQDAQVAEWNARRSIPLKMLAHLTDINGASFISLQKGVDTAQLVDFPAMYDYTDAIESWSDTAGIMHHLDLILSIDSGPVHLAGALGRPTLLLNHVHTCWRWALEGEEAPWYDSVRVLRQEREGDWSVPVAQATAIIAEMAADV